MMSDQETKKQITQELVSVPKESYFILNVIRSIRKTLSMG